jgi:hypothetical protein
MFYLTIGTFSGVKFNVFLAFYYMLFEITLDMKLVLSKFHVISLKSNNENFQVFLFRRVHRS